MSLRVLCLLSVVLSGESLLVDPHLAGTAARATVQGAVALTHAHEAAERVKFQVAKAQLHALRAAQPHHHALPHHTAVLPHFSVRIPASPDPRTILHHHHHHHHPGKHFHGGFHSGSSLHGHQHGFHHGGFSDFSDHPHKPLHERPHTHVSQTIVNNINARRRFPETHRWKRDLPAIAAARIAADPHVKLNVIGTVDNLKDATKDLCEHEHSPFYHVRNAVGSARDAFFSVLKVAPNGLLVPTSYTIAEIEEMPPETVGTAQGNFVREARPDPEPKNTLDAIQNMVKNGFRSARDSATHIGDTIHSARRAILAFPKSTLKLLLPYLRALELERERKGLPKGLLGTSLKRPSPNEVPKIVGAGRILELLRKAASKDDSGEIVAQVQCPRRDFKETYKQFLNRLKEGISDKINSIQ